MKHAKIIKEIATGLAFIAVLAGGIQGCGMSKEITKPGNSALKTDSTESDSVEHRLIVLDPYFESYLRMQPGMHYHSKSYYETRNRWYVQEWNSRYLSGDDPEIYETYIDYDPDVDYNLEIEYKLYHYFRYVMNKHNINLSPGGFR